MWRYFGLNDAMVVAIGALSGSAAALVAILASTRFISYSRTVFAIDFFLVVGLVTMSRASFRLIGDFVQRRRHGAERVVIYGAGDAGALVARELLNRRDRAIRVLGFVDDNPRTHGSRVLGYRVLGGQEALRGLVWSARVDAIVISSRAIPDASVAPLARLCAERHITISRLRVGLEDVLTPPGSDAGVA